MATRRGSTMFGRRASLVADPIEGAQKKGVKIAADDGAKAGCVLLPLDHPAMQPKELVDEAMPNLSRIRVISSR